MNTVFDDMHIITLMILSILYFTPSLVAGWRHHHSALAILVLNLTLGWTLLGWVIALIWSFTATKGKLA